MKKVEVGFTFRTAKGLKAAVVAVGDIKSKIQFLETGTYVHVANARICEGSSIKDPTVVASVSGTVMGIGKVTHDGSRKDRALAKMAKDYWRAMPKKMIGESFLDFSNFELWFYSHMDAYYQNQDWVMLSVGNTIHGPDTTYFVDREVADFLSCDYSLQAFRSPQTFRGYAGKKAVTSTLRKVDAVTALKSFLVDKVAPYLNKMTDNGRKQYELIQDGLK